MTKIKYIIVKMLSFLHRFVRFLSTYFGYTLYIFTKNRVLFSYLFVDKDLVNSTDLNDDTVKWINLDSNTKNKFLLEGTSEYIDKHINEIEKIEFIYDKNLLDMFIKKADKKYNFYYGETDKYLFEYLDNFSIKNKNVAILGSTVPWYEAIVLSRKGNPFTFEYNEIQTNDKRLTTYKFEEWSKNSQKFDVVFSISSFEHDGLGRYGDPINPDGDILAMKSVKENLISKNGVLVLSVPIGKDAVAFNAHRIYGKTRFEKLTEGFEIVDSFGFEEPQFDRYKTSGNISTKKNSDWPFQPIFILKPE